MLKQLLVATLATALVAGPATVAASHASSTPAPDILGLHQLCENLYPPMPQADLTGTPEEEQARALARSAYVTIREPALALESACHDMVRSGNQDLAAQWSVATAAVDLAWHLLVDCANCGDLVLDQILSALDQVAVAPVLQVGGAGLAIADLTIDTGAFAVDYTAGDVLVPMAECAVVCLLSPHVQDLVVITVNSCRFMIGPSCPGA